MTTVRSLIDEDPDLVMTQTISKRAPPPHDLPAGSMQHNKIQHPRRSSGAGDYVSLFLSFLDFNHSFTISSVNCEMLHFLSDAICSSISLVHLSVLYDINSVLFGSFILSPHIHGISFFLTLIDLSRILGVSGVYHIYLLIFRSVASWAASSHGREINYREELNMKKLFAYPPDRSDPLKVGDPYG